MTKEEMLNLVKQNLKLEEDDSKDLIISDVIQDAMNYCNIKDLPREMEIYIRKKSQSIIDFEEKEQSGTKDIASIREGDTTITYNTSKPSSESVYDLNKDDKRALRMFRRLRK